MDLKKLWAEAGTSFNRVVQLTQENLGNVEKTEYDPHFENLLQLTDATEKWTRRMVSDMEAYIQPNPAIRLEEFVADQLEEWVERKKPADVLGETFQAAGSELGPTTSYGDALQQVGRAHTRLANAERRFIYEVVNSYIKPLKDFLDNKIASIRRERSTLEDYRLDLDRAKNKYRKAVNDKSKAANDEAIKRMEIELHNAQRIFDEQFKTTKELLEDLHRDHDHHLRCLMVYLKAAHDLETHRLYHIEELEKNLQETIR